MKFGMMQLLNAPFFIFQLIVETNGAHYDLEVDCYFENSLRGIN